MSSQGSHAVKRRYKLPKAEVVHVMFRYLNQTFFEDRLVGAEFHWLSPVSFSAASRAQEGRVYLHPKLFDPQWKLLLEFEIYRQLLGIQYQDKPRAVHSLQYRRAEARIGNLHDRLRLRRLFLHGLYKRYARPLRLREPHPAILSLWNCSRCGWGAATLATPSMQCELCRLRKPVVMKLWDQVPIMQHYKNCISPADYTWSEATQQKVFVYEDTFLSHFVQ